MMDSETQRPKVIVKSEYRYVSRHLVRPKVESYRAGAFKIYLDRVDSGYLPALGCRVFEVDAGAHQLRLQFHWYRSRPINFEIGSSESIVFSGSIPRKVSTLVKLLILPWSSLELNKTSIAASQDSD